MAQEPSSRHLLHVYGQGVTVVHSVHARPSMPDRCTFLSTEVVHNSSSYYSVQVEEINVLFHRVYLVKVEEITFRPPVLQ